MHILPQPCQFSKFSLRTIISQKWKNCYTYYKNWSIYWQLQLLAFLCTDLLHKQNSMEICVKLVSWPLPTMLRAILIITMNIVQHDLQSYRLQRKFNSQCHSINNTSKFEQCFMVIQPWLVLKTNQLAVKLSDFLSKYKYMSSICVDLDQFCTSRVQQNPPAFTRPSFHLMGGIPPQRLFIFPIMCLVDFYYLFKKNGFHF